MSNWIHEKRLEKARKDAEEILEYFTEQFELMGLNTLTDPVVRAKITDILYAKYADIRETAKEAYTKSIAEEIERITIMDF